MQQFQDISKTVPRIQVDILGEAQSVFIAGLNNADFGLAAAMIGGYRKFGSCLPWKTREALILLSTDVDQDWFFNTLNTGYWLAGATAFDGNIAWYVPFRTGSANYGADNRSKWQG